MGSQPCQVNPKSVARALAAVPNSAAAATNPCAKAAYLDLARQWTKLATDIEMAEASRRTCVAASITPVVSWLTFTLARTSSTGASGRCNHGLMLRCLAHQR